MRRAFVLVLAACTAPSGPAGGPRGGESADPGPGDSAEPGDSDDPDDSGVVADTADGAPLTLRSEDAVDPGDCVTLTPLCADGACRLDVDLTTVTLAGRFSGVDAAGADWRLVLQDPTIDLVAANPLSLHGFGTPVSVGAQALALPADTYRGRVLPGVYDLAVETTSGSTVTRHFPVASGWTLAADTTLDLDLPVHGVSIRVLRDGAPLAAPGVSLRFDDATSGAYATESLDVPARLPDGTWTVSLDVGEGPGLAQGLHPLGVIEVAGADVAIELEWVTVPLRATLRVDGAEVVGDATVELVDAAGAELRTPVEGSLLQVEVPAGVWDVWLGDTLMAEDLAVTAPVEVELDNLTVPITGALRVDGGAAGPWHLELIDPIHGVESTLEGADVQSVNPGTYDVYVAHDSGAVGRRLAEGVELRAATTLAFEVATAEVTGTTRWTGHARPDAWALLFVDRASRRASRADSGHTDSTWAVTLPRGRYDVYLAATFAPATVSYVALAHDLDIEGDLALDLQGSTHALGGAARLDGAAPGAWALWRHDVADAEWVTDSFAADGSAWATTVPPGVYHLFATVPAWTAEGVDQIVPLATCVEIGPS